MERYTFLSFILPTCDMGTVNPAPCWRGAFETGLEGRERVFDRQGLGEGRRVFRTDYRRACGDAQSQ